MKSGPKPKKWEDLGVYYQWKLKLKNDERVPEEFRIQMKQVRKLKPWNELSMTTKKNLFYHQSDRVPEGWEPERKWIVKDHFVKAPKMSELFSKERKKLKDEYSLQLKKLKDEYTLKFKKLKEDFSTSEDKTITLQGVEFKCQITRRKI